MLDNLKYIFVFAFTLVSMNGCYAQKVSIEKEIIKVLSRGQVGKVVSFNNSNKDYGLIYDYLQYMGVLKSNKDSLYKITTATTVWGENKHTINFLYVYDTKCHFIGKYKYLLPDELPIKISANKLVYYKRTDDGNLDKSKFTFVGFENGLPDIICPGCDDIYNGMGAALIKDK